MANEITHNWTSGLTLYFCCFQQDGDVFLTGGASDEVWGTGGRTADDYDEAMTEEATSGHYKGSMAAGIGTGVYQIQVRLQAGANPANTDIVIGQGEIYWDGSAEINPYTSISDLTIVDSNIDAILSDLTVTNSVCDTIASDLTINNSVIDTIASDLIITNSVCDTIASDLIITDSNLDTVNSDLVVMDSNIDTAVSDINYVIALEQVQNNDWGDGSGGGSSGQDGTGTNDFGAAGGAGC